ncbi:MAG: pyrroline-5-carboxylate reductase [Solirubrobacterales bacterium]|nr:pyrroline-5-carboxylate reductase [Solirubrobacterales bacterium]
MVAMQIGLIGSGNMARAMVRGWGEPVLCTDALPGRAEALAAEVGGEAVGGNAELAQRADLVILCHKPPQLGEVAAEIAPHVRAVASILGGVPLAALREAYGDTPVHRFMPSTPVEVRQGAVIHARDGAGDPAVLELFGRLGTLVSLPESQVDVAMALMSNAPAYWALLVEAQIDAGVRHGLPADQAAALVVQTMGGTAALLRERAYDTLAVRREVTSPGGSTARGLDALERAGVRAAFSDAADAVLGGR